MAENSIRIKSADLTGLVVPLLQLSWPTIATFSVLSVRSLVDVWLIGRLGVNDLAAIAPAHLVMLFLVSFGFGSLYAVNSFVSQSKGAGRPDECGRYAWQGIWHAALFGAAIGIAGFYGAGFFRLFGHPPEVAMRESAYFKVAVLSVFPQLTAFAAVNFFFGIGRTLVPMVAAIGSVATHSIVGYGLVLGNWDMPGLGIAGAGWALVVSSTIQAISLVCWLVIDREAREFGSRQMSLSFHRLGNLWKVGLPFGFRDLLDNLVWGIAFIWLIGKLGAVPLATATVLLACIDVSLLPCDGLGAALVTTIGSALGERNPRKADSWRKAAMRLMSGYALAVGLVFFLFRIPFIGFLTTDPAVVVLGSRLAFFVPILLLLYAWNIALEHALCGAGDNLWPALINVLLTTIVLGVGGFLFVSRFQQANSQGVWLLVTVNLTLVVTALWLRWKSNAWQRISLFEESDHLIGS